MFRFLSIITFTISVILFISDVNADEPQSTGGIQTDTLELGKATNGEIDGEMRHFPLNNRSNNHLYQSKYSISLRAGQSISISASVTGKGRRVALSLHDPKAVSMQISEFEERAATLKFEEVHATGVYTIFVGSDRIGPFILSAVGEGKAPVALASDLNLASLEKRLKQLEQEVMALKEEVQSLKAKTKSSR